MAGEPVSATPSRRDDPEEDPQRTTEALDEIESPTIVMSENGLSIFRTRLQVDIDYHLTKLLTLRAQWNATVPILQLPPELLGEICMAYVLILYTTEPIPFQPGVNQFCVWFSWILKLTQISRHWRAVALSLPAMWSYIPSSRTHPELMKLWIQRSKDASLRAAMASGNPIIDKSCRLLLGEYHRMHTLNVELCKDFYDKFAKEEWFRGPAIRMERLTLGWPLNDFDGRNSSLYLPTLFATENLPHLKHFNYDGSQFDWIHSLLPHTLTELRIQRLSTYPDLETPKEALDVLEGLPNLKILSLKDAVPVSKHTHPTLRDINLQHIESVELETNHPFDCARFLSCLSIPPQASIRIECLIGNTAHARDIARSVASKCPRQHVRFDSITVKPLASGMLGVHILVFTPPTDDGLGSTKPAPPPSCPCGHTNGHETDQAAHITLDLIIPATGIGPFDPECDTLDLLLHLFQEFGSVFEPVRQLDLDNPRLEQDPLPTMDSRIFCTFASLVNLESLTSRGMATPRLLPMMLANPPIREPELEEPSLSTSITTTLDGREIAGAGSSSSSSLISTSHWHAFHKLSELRIQGVCDTVDASAEVQLDRIVHTLEERRRAKIRQIEKLWLEEIENCQGSPGVKFSGLAKEIWVDGALFESNVDLRSTSDSSTERRVDTDTDTVTHDGEQGLRLTSADEKELRVRMEAVKMADDVS